MKSATVQRSADYGCQIHHFPADAANVVVGIEDRQPPARFWRANNWLRGPSGGFVEAFILFGLTVFVDLSEVVFVLFLVGG